MRYQEDNRAASSVGDLLPESLCCQRGVQLGQMAAWCFGMLWPSVARCQQVDCVGRLLMNYNLLEQGAEPVDWGEYWGLRMQGTSSCGPMRMEVFRRAERSCVALGIRESPT